MSTNKLLLYGALAVGGYLLWQKYQQQQQAQAQAQAAATQGSLFGSALLSGLTFGAF